MALHLVDKVAKFLTNNPNQKFTAPDIADWIYKTYPDECKIKQKNSKAIKMPLNTPEALIQQLIREINASRTRIEKKNIRLTEGRPRKFYFTNESDNAEVIEAEAVKAPILENELATVVSEHALYPLLADYLTQEFGIYSKRIDEKRSSNKRGPNGNKWLYPDLVAMENLSKDWNQEIKNCVKEYFDKKTRLWSFEVKILINSSNVREVFFQTVSNSSWANFAYLVTNEINSDALKEIRILSGVHGIGLIVLNIKNGDDISESQVLIPAREKNDVDWNSANRLAEENKDFLEFIKQVRHFYQTGDIIKNNWFKEQILFD